ncbi:MAG: DUF2336 domain-containing protein [Alphaproteobacteria bacterium]
MTSSKRLDVDRLLSMAREKSTESRNALAATIGDYFASHNATLTDRELALMTDILRRLIHDVEMSVRKHLAEQLARNLDAPRELIVTLANDEIDVALPILVESEVLRDEELIDIIRHRTLEHQLAIAMRRTLSEVVSDVLVETGNESVVVRLLENQNADISDKTMAYLVDQSKRVDSYQNPLVHRHDLSPELAERMYGWVSAALREHILENFDLDPGRLDSSIEESAKTALQEHEKNGVDPPAASILADKLLESDHIDGKLMVEMLRQGELALFEALLGKVLQVEPALMQRLIYHPGGQGLAIACRAVDIDKAVFASIFLLSRQARPGDQNMALDETSEVLQLYERIDNTAAQAILARWRRNPKIEELLGELEDLPNLPPEH